MADQKLSQLTAIGGAVLSTDDIYMQRAGTSYRVPFSNIVSSHTHAVEDLTDNANYVRMSTAERTKLSGIATGATNTNESPTGTIVMFAGASAPAGGWLICDGSLVSTTTYATLFALIAYTYGGGGATFALPDMRGSVAIGVGTGAGLTTRALGDTGGEETHVLTKAELASHKHGIKLNHENGGTNDSTGWPQTDGSGPIAIHAETEADYSSADPAGNGNPLGSTGSDNGHNTMQPFVALNFIIKT